jgi:hypothetical protein
MALLILSNCRSMSARRLTRVSSTRCRRSMSASTVIRDRFTFAIVISGRETSVTFSNSKFSGPRDFGSDIFLTGVYKRRGGGPSPSGGGGPAIPWPLAAPS